MQLIFSYAHKAKNLSLQRMSWKNSLLPSATPTVTAWVLQLQRRRKKKMLQEQQGNMGHWFNFFVVVYFTVYCQREVEPGDCFRRTACCVCLRNSNFVTQVIFFFYLFLKWVQCCFLLLEDISKEVGLALFTFRKPGIVVGPGKFLFILPWVQSPRTPLMMLCSFGEVLFFHP